MYPSLLACLPVGRPRHSRISSLMWAFEISNALPYIGRPHSPPPRRLVLWGKGVRYSSTGHRNPQGVECPIQHRLAARTTRALSVGASSWCRYPALAGQGHLSWPFLPVSLPRPRLLVPDPLRGLLGWWPPPCPSARCPCAPRLGPRRTCRRPRDDARPRPPRRSSGRACSSICATSEPAHRRRERARWRLYPTLPPADATQPPAPAYAPGVTSGPPTQRGNCRRERRGWRGR